MKISVSSSRGRVILYALLFLSGAAGLLYQVVWHKYLSILLGAHARATSVVLAIFLGGISSGYLSFGYWSRWRPWNLLKVFCLVELGLGLWALAFPLLFKVMLPVISALYGLIGVESLLIDVLSAAVLIGPPTFLMGGTLPLLTQGLSTDLKEASQTHARIYGFNTVGACFGSLIAGYFLISWVGLTWSSFVGAAINWTVALITFLLFARYSTNQKVVKAPVKSTQSNEVSLHTSILFSVGFLSGFYVLCLETVLIRLMGLNTGSSNYSFTLIVSIFVFGLGIGSLLVRRISQYSRFQLFLNQVGVCFTLLVLYTTGDKWGYFAHLIRIMFNDNVFYNFYVYQVLLGLMFLLLLIIPIGLCGLALPLCFHLLKDTKENLGNRVGQLYGLNTIGAVLGALVGGYLLLNFINLDHLFKVCVGLTWLSAVLAYCSYMMDTKPARWKKASVGAVVGALFIAILWVPLYNKAAFLQPFRQQKAGEYSFSGPGVFVGFLGTAANYIFYGDGPNSTIGIGSAITNGKEKSRTIFVNGKSDGNTTGDFHTMNLTGQIPALLARSLDNVCVVGFGTGITAGAITSYSELGKIDIVEISKFLVEKAHLFDEYNGGVSIHSKVNFNQMDAFRFLEGTRTQYDLIISEPSNPWVTGVENLFSDDFYKIAKKRLKDDGIYVQWLQGYAFQEDLTRSVLKTLTNNFKSVRVFQMMTSDYALIASDTPLEYEDAIRAEVRLKNNPIAQNRLKRSGLNRIESIFALEMVPDSLSPVLGANAPVITLDRPFLSMKATQAFFERDMVKMDVLRKTMKEYYPAVSRSMLSLYLGEKGSSKELVDEFKKSFCAHKIADNPRLCAEAILMGNWLDRKGKYVSQYPELLPDEEVRKLAYFRDEPAAKFDDKTLEDIRYHFGFLKTMYSPVARIPVKPLIEKLNACYRLVAPTESLYGDCLLQEAAIMEIMNPETSKFIPVMERFQDWFTVLSPETKNYKHFREASKILARLTEELKKKDQSDSSK